MNKLLKRKNSKNDVRNSSIESSDISDEDLLDELLLAEDDEEDTDEREEPEVTIFDKNCRENLKVLPREELIASAEIGFTQLFLEVRNNPAREKLIRRDISLDNLINRMGSSECEYLDYHDEPLFLLFLIQHERFIAEIAAYISKCGGYPYFIDDVSELFVNKSNAELIDFVEKINFHLTWEKILKLGFMDKSE